MNVCDWRGSLAEATKSQQAEREERESQHDSARIVMATFRDELHIGGMPVRHSGGWTPSGDELIPASDNYRTEATSGILCHGCDERKHKCQSKRTRQ